MFRDDLARTLGLSAEPDYYLWAWRREEDLSFIDPARVKVALWTGTIFVDDDDFHIEHRANRITYPTQADIIGVVRLEATGVPDDGIVPRLADAIIAASRPFRPVEHQLDFDARLSQRDFYRRLLAALRNRTGDAGLSITALASWCFHDDWVRALPVDAVVPMIYRMGPDGDAIRHTLYTERAFPAPVCDGNIGYSADEPLVFETATDKHFEAARIVFEYPAFSPWILSGPGRVLDGHETRYRGTLSGPRPMPDYVADGRSWLNWWCASPDETIERLRGTASGRSAGAVW